MHGPSWTITFAGPVSYVSRMHSIVEATMLLSVPFRPEWAVAGPLVGAALPMRDAVPAVVDDARCGLLSCLQWSRTQWRQSMSCNTPLIVRRCRRGYLGARGPVVNPVLSGRLSGQSTMISRYRRHDHAGRPRCSGQHCPSLTGVAGHIASQRRSG